MKTLIIARHGNTFAKGETPTRVGCHTDLELVEEERGRGVGLYLKKLGLTYTQYIVMMVMWESVSVSSRDLAAKVHLDYGTLTPVLKKLESTGYITRKRDPEDERLLILGLTDKGEAIKDEALKIPPCIASCVGLNEEEFKMLYILTYKALNNMENKKCKNK